MPVSFIFAWRLEQQQVTHVSTAISRTVTVKQKQRLEQLALPYSIKNPLTKKGELTHEGQDDKECSQVDGVGVGQILELDPYLVHETERLFLSIHPEAEMRWIR